MYNDCEFKNKVSIVTGAAQGIGKALAKRLIEEGVQVVICDMNESAVKKTAEEIHAVAGLRCDVTVPEDCVKVAAYTYENYGKIDYLISNAGILISGAVDEIDTYDWKKVIDVNLWGGFNICQAVVPYMKKVSKGSIVQINSKSGKKGSYKSSAYAASKFGGIGMVQSLALELAENKIRVNAICPGNLMDSPLWTDSLNDQYARNRGMTKEAVYEYYQKQVPLGRTCSYKDVENMMLFLLSDGAEYITGQAMNVTGGFEMR